MLSAPDKTHAAEEATQAVAPFLRLLAAQTLGARDSASEPVGKLIESFSHILMSVNQLMQSARQDSEDLKQFQADIQTQCAAIRQLCNQAITQLQFADALSQRLEHVAEGLTLLEEHIGESSGKPPKEWEKLEKQLLDTYTVASEEVIHKTVFPHHQADS